MVQGLNREESAMNEKSPATDRHKPNHAIHAILGNPGRAVSDHSLDFCLAHPLQLISAASCCLPTPGPGGHAVALCQDCAVQATADMLHKGQGHVTKVH